MFTFKSINYTILGSYKLNYKKRLKNKMILEKINQTTFDLLKNKSFAET